MRRETGGCSSRPVTAPELEASSLGAPPEEAHDVSVTPPSAAAHSAAADLTRGRGPLSAEDFAQLARAGARLRALRRAVLLARLHGIGLLALALFSLPFALFEPELWWLVLVSCGGAAAEWRGARLLRAFDARGPRWLGAHQLLLFGLVALYCAFGIQRAVTAPSFSTEVASVHPALADALGDGADAGGEQIAELIDGTYRAAMIGFYCVLLFVSALYQGACAGYHFTRAAVLRAYRNDTPPWAARVLEGLLGW